MSNTFKKRHTGRLIAICLTAMMLFGSIPFSSISPMQAFANTVNAEQDKLDDLNAQEDDLNAEQNDLQAQIDEQLAQQSEYLDQMLAVQTVIDEYQVEIDAANDEIDSLTEQIDDKQAEIDQKQIEIDQKQAELEEANETFKDRLAVMYILSGDMTAINVLFGAESFSDFLTQAQALRNISKNDRSLMDDLEAIKQELLTLQSEMQTQKIDLENNKMEVETQKQSLLDLQAEQQAQYDSFESMKAEVDALISSISDLYSSNEGLLDEIAADKKAVQDEIDRLIEESMAQKPDNGGSTGGSSSGSTGGGSAGGNSNYVPSAAGWTHPCPIYTYISTYFNVVDAWHSTAHKGVDFASPGGNPIYATRAGTVTISTLSPSYGNYIMIDHGDGFYSVYAHASALYVSVGETVSQGQHIAAVGTTGYSSGNHLHFEIRYNGSFVDPLKYI